MRHMIFWTSERTKPDSIWSVRSLVSLCFQGAHFEQTLYITTAGVEHFVAAGKFTIPVHILSVFDSLSQWFFWPFEIQFHSSQCKC